MIIYVTDIATWIVCFVIVVTGEVTPCFIAMSAYQKAMVNAPEPSKHEGKSGHHLEKSVSKAAHMNSLSGSV